MVQHHASRALGPLARERDNGDTPGAKGQRGPLKTPVKRQPKGRKAAEGNHVPWPLSSKGGSKKKGRAVWNYDGKKKNY